MKWQNVQNVELKQRNQKRLGKWQAVQTKLENVCNSKSVSTNAQNVATFSAKYSAKRKSNIS